jgi:hypothetical protein
VNQRNLCPILIKNPVHHVNSVKKESLDQFQGGKFVGAGKEILSRLKDERLLFDSVYPEVFLIKGDDIMYPRIHCDAYNRGISEIHRKIRVFFYEFFCFFQTLNARGNYFDH